MQLFADIAAYQPQTPQEKQDKQVILEAIRLFPDTVLLRGNPFAHLTSSGFVLNPSAEKALLVHHNILGTWAWTGGHADGDGDLLAVALREAEEETGAAGLRPLSKKIASLDVLPVPPHIKNGRFVNAHLHLSVAYLLVCDEAQALRCKPDENTGVRWFLQSEFTPDSFNAADLALYQKLFNRAKL